RYRTLPLLTRPHSQHSLVAAMNRSPTASFLSSPFQHGQTFLSSAFEEGMPLYSRSRSQSPMESAFLSSAQPEYSDLFAAPADDALAIPIDPGNDSDKENEWPDARTRPLWGRQIFPGSIAVTGQQVMDFRIHKAIEQHRELTWPECVMAKIVFLDDEYEFDLWLWALRAHLEWYLYDPEGAMRTPQDRWWELTGKAYCDFLSRLALPPFVAPTMLLPRFPLPILSNPDFKCGPHPVKGSTAVMDLVVGMSPRDWAYTTAGSTAEIVAGKTYRFKDVFPQLDKHISFEKACAVAGMSEARFTRMATQLGNYESLTTPPSTPPPPRLRSPLSPITPTPAISFPEFLPESPYFPENVGIDDEDLSGMATPRSFWGSSSTYQASSPLPPSEFDPESDKEEEEEVRPRNWKTGQRIYGPLGRWSVPPLCTRQTRGELWQSWEGKQSLDAWTYASSTPPLLTRSKDSIRITMASRKPGARPKNPGFTHDFDMRNNASSRPQHTSFVLSRDGRRVAGTTTTFAEGSGAGQKKKKHSHVNPEDLEAAHSNWRPVEDSAEPDIAFEYPSLDEQAGTWQQCDAGDKRKRQARLPIIHRALADPMQTWKTFSDQQYLDEFMWLEGLRYSLEDPCCATCQAAYAPRAPNPPADAPDAGRLFCCWECGDFNECLSCCLDRHERMPLHHIEEWTGQYWEKVSLTSLGLIYQLGHGGGACPLPEPLVRNLTVLDRGVHSLRIRYCGCRLGPTSEHTVQLLRNRWYPATATDPESCATFALLDWFRLASVHANVNTHGLTKVLEMLTDALGITKVPRGGRGNAKSGIRGTVPGELAVRCWACPRLGINLPPNWQNVADSEKYRFMTMLAVDANFRLKNRIRANETGGGALGEGYGYFVDTQPYKDHLAGYVKESDISSCIAFAALTEKDTKITKGLRVSGVGGVICARHELIQPHGFGDLQKGERYCNIDYVLCSVLSHLKSPLTTCSYDIGCQYMTNFYTRVEKLPSHIRPDPTADLSFCLPVWHGAIHEESCRAKNSLKYQEGVGRTDGEGVERIWSLFNALAYSTKEMGEGARHDAIEDKTDSVNFMKNVGNGTILLRRLIIALDERHVQIEAYKRVNENVDSKQVAAWKAEIKKWRQDTSGRSPYAMPEAQGVSELEVRRMLDAEEMEEVKQGRAGVHATSQTAFLSAGLQLEAAQRRIMADLHGPTVVPMNLEGLINNRRRAFLSKKDNFEQLQAVYMPGAQAYIEACEGDVHRAVDAELMKLYMPSDLPPVLRRQACAEGIPQKELKLRVAQAHDFLQTIRRKLHAKQYHITWRNEHTTGQKKSTRARALLKTLQEKIDLDAAGYRKARVAILALRGVEEDPEFPPLLAADLRLEGDEDEPDAAAMTQMARAGLSSRPRQVHVSSGKQTMSWIWTAKGLPSDEKEANVLETVRCLWAKALARKERWEEEVVILQEDMRRCLRSLESESQTWRERASVDIGKGEAYASGTRAYALRHAEQWTRLRDHFQDGWNKPLGRAKRRIFEEYATSDTLDTELTASLAAARAMLDSGGATASMTPSAATSSG
ncbi:hypothetical protein GGF50DRAFT_60884, partial [Schizophyllum commune]